MGTTQNYIAINTKLFNFKEIKKYFFDKKLKNVILFSQLRKEITHTYTET